MFKRVLIIACLFIIIAAHALAGGKDPAAEDPVVTITPPTKHVLKKIVFFPLELPEYALRAATWPIGVADKYFKRKGVFEKAANALSYKHKTLWIYPIIEGGAGWGFGGGPGIKDIDLFNKGYVADAYYTIHVDLSQRAGGSIGHPYAFTLKGRPVAWNISPKWKRLTEEKFFGIGNNSSRANRSEYLLNETDIIGDVTYKFSRLLGVNLHLGYSIATTGHVNDTYPSVETVFPAAQIPGYGRWLGYGIAGLALVHDTRDNTSLPEAGSLYSLRFTRYQHLGKGNYSFNEYNADLRQFIRFGGPKHVMTLHTGWLFKQETGGSRIPFYRLAKLDVNSPLRGFVHERFADLDSAVFNAEYRFPIWNALDGVIFADTGRVFHGITDFSFDNFKYSFGGGARIKALNLMLFRVDLAYGGEGLNVIFGMTKSL